MLPLDLRLTRRRVVAGAAALLLTACGSVGPAKVAVDTLYTNIVFGAPTGASAPAALPAQPPAAYPVTAPVSPVFVLPPPAPAPTFSFAPPLPTPPPTDCPTAPNTLFPAVAAGSDVNGTPPPGRYRWVSSGSFDISLTVGSGTGILAPFQDRTVSAATAIKDPFSTLPTSFAGSDFTYQTTEPHVGGADRYLVTWKVKDSQSPTAPADPEGGLSISEVDTVDALGHVTGTVFKPTTGLLILPLPVTPGQAFQSAALDTTASNNSMAFKATVGTQKDRVDACGTPLQAWAVDGTLAAANGASTATVHFDVATQMGGLVVAESIDGGYLGTTFHTAHFRIGQAQPDPAS